MTEEDTGNPDDRYYPGVEKVISANDPSGNKATLYAQWTQNKLKIVYNRNCPVTGTGSMSDQYFNPGERKQLLNNNYTCTGRIFQGWSKSSSATTATYTNQYNYAAENPISEATKTVRLYAVWKKVDTMQDMDSTVCVTTGNTKLKDSRDGKEYNVRKLSDGKCWMMENLSLDLTNSTTLSNVNATNTNADATSINCLKNGGCASPYASIGVNTTNTSSNSAYILEAYNNIYYGSCTASAGSECDGSSSDIEQDICPAGWKIPTVSEFLQLNSTDLSTMSIPLSGWDASRGLDVIGVLWTSTAAFEWQGDDFYGYVYGTQEQAKSYVGSMSSNYTNIGGFDKTRYIPIRCVKQ